MPKTVEDWQSQLAEISNTIEIKKAQNEDVSFLSNVSKVIESEIHYLETGEGLDLSDLAAEVWDWDD